MEKKEEKRNFKQQEEMKRPYVEPSICIYKAEPTNLLVASTPGGHNPADNDQIIKDVAGQNNDENE